MLLPDLTADSRMKVFFLTDQLLVGLASISTLIGGDGGERRSEEFQAVPFLSTPSSLSESSAVLPFSTKLIVSCAFLMF
jgi:hypothetical protein